MRSVQRGGHLGKVRNKPTVEINHVDESGNTLGILRRREIPNALGPGRVYRYTPRRHEVTEKRYFRLGVRHLLRIDCKASPTQPNQDLLKMFNVFRERLTVDQKVIKIIKDIPELHIVEDGVEQPS
ncbi:hypothetical protein J6590_041083 [Homalodisca vitripennis]|nr:hypothetical protein J6590_041083 [Homalodisca vitripennis]